MKNDRLTNMLLVLSRSIGQIINEMKEKGRLKRHKVPYRKTKFTKFDYKSGKLNWQLTTEQIIKEEWNWSITHEVLENNIKNGEEFSKVVRKICSIFKVTKNQSENWVSRFANSVIRENLNGGSEDRIVELTLSFIRDLDGSPKLWQPIVWLKGARAQNCSVSTGSGHLKSIIQSSVAMISVVVLYMVILYPPKKMLLNLTAELWNMLVSRLSFFYNLGRNVRKTSFSTELIVHY